jgi:hypothetical protein
VAILQKYIPQVEHEKLLLPLFPVACIGVGYKVDLFQKFKSLRYRSVSNEIGNFRYNRWALCLEQDWLRICTESRMEMLKQGFTANCFYFLYSIELNWIYLHSINPKYATLFVGDLKAKNIALLQLFV